METTAPAPRLRDIRKALDMTCAEAAARCGLSERGWHKLETGGCTPRLDTARRIAYGLGTKVDLLFPPAADE